MKKTILSIFFSSIVLIGFNIVLTSSSRGRASDANSGNTGAPNETTTCRSCHGTGFGTTVAITIKDNHFSFKISTDADICGFSGVGYINGFTCYQHTTL